MNAPDHFNTRNLNLFNFEQFRLQQIETESQKRNTYLKILVPLALGIIFIAIYYNWIVFGVIAIIILISAYYLIMYQVKKVYVQKFKAEILTKLVSSMDDSFRYIPQTGMNLKEFRESNFIKGSNYVYGEDFISGNLHNFSFKGSEIKVEAGSGKHKHQVFRGMFFKVSFQTIIEGTVEVLPDTAEKHFGHLGTYLQSINMSRPHVVRFENEVFEKLFVVYSSSDDLAQRIITPQLTNTLVKLCELFGDQIYFSVHNGNLYFGINNNDDLFKVNINNSLQDGTLIKNYYLQLFRYISALQEVLETTGK